MSTPTQNRLLYEIAGMLDLIIISYKLTINVSVTFQEYIQYLVDYTYNNCKNCSSNGLIKIGPRESQLKVPNTLGKICKKKQIPEKTFFSKKWFCFVLGFF